MLQTQVLLAILVIAIPVDAGSYLTIQETILDSDKINVVFENLIQGEWYRLNWTDNKDGYFFQFSPDESSGQQAVELTLKNTYNRKYFIFELWYDQANELLVSTTRFWGDNVSTDDGEFYIPLLSDAIYFINNVPPEMFILLVFSIIGWKVFSFIFRRGR